MEAKVPMTIKKTFVNYTSEAKTELEELSKLDVIAYNGRLSKQNVYITVKKAEAIEVRIYNLSNFSKNTYTDFNKKVRRMFYNG